MKWEECSGNADRGNEDREDFDGGGGCHFK